MPCSYCQYKIKNPCRLICGHTFCRSCLLKHVAHNIRHSFQGFSCIHCRRKYDYIYHDGAFGLKTHEGILWSVSVTGKISAASIWRRSARNGRLVRRHFLKVLPALSF